jgi:hypothetical protein
LEKSEYTLVISLAETPSFPNVSDWQERS